MKIGESPLCVKEADDVMGSPAAQTGHLPGGGCAQEGESGGESEGLRFETVFAANPWVCQYRKQKHRVVYHVALQLGQRLLDLGIFRQVCVCVRGVRVCYLNISRDNLT